MVTVKNKTIAEQSDTGKEIVFLRILMLVYGFAPALVYTPLFFIYIIYVLLFINIKFNKASIFYFLVALLYISYTFSLGNSYLDQWHLTMLTQLISLVAVFLIVSTNSSVHLVQFIRCFILGVGLHVSILFAATMSVDPLLIGRNLLYSPIAQELVGTSAQSNYLSLVACLILYQAAIQRNAFSLLASLSCFTLILIAGASMAGRAFFLAIAVFGLLIGAHYASLKRTIITLVFLFVSIFLALSFFGHIVEPIFNKFEAGLSTLRFEHWEYGLNVAPDYPFGGFEVNQAIEEIGSFHNIFLDSARMGGFGSVMLILILLMPTALLLKRKIVGNFDFVYAISLVCVLIMMQDVVIEGSYKILIIYLMANFALYKKVGMGTHSLGGISNRAS